MAVTSNWRSFGEPVNGRRARSSIEPMTSSPGSTRMTIGSNAKVTLSSSSNAESSTSSGWLPSLRRMMPTVADFPAVTVGGSSSTRVVTSAGMSTSTGTVSTAPGAVTSRTCTARRRIPAGTPVGSVIVTATTFIPSGNSDGRGSSIDTQSGSTPSTESS